MELKKADQIVKILTGYTFFIGVISEITEHSIMLKDACTVLSHREGKNISYTLHKVNGLVTIRGSCCVYEVDETDQFYKSYIQTITGIIPGNFMDMNRLKREIIDMEFKVDLKGHDEIKRSLDILGKKSGTVVARSINKVATSMRAGGIKAIKEEYTIKASELRDAMKIQKANRNRLFAIINTIGTRLKLRKAYETFQFNLAKNKKRVMVQVLKKGTPKILRHSFYATMKSGHKGIYERMGRPRLPIKELYGPSLPQIVRAVRIKKVWERIYNERMLPTLSHEVEAELKGYIREWE